MASEKSSKSTDKTKLTQEQIYANFNKLRQDQKNLVAKLTEVEQDLNEHSLVVDALRDVNPERVCYRMVGGVLVERTVQEVLPAVARNKDGLSSIIEALNKQIEDKGKEINGFVEKHNIPIRKDTPNLIAEPGPEQSQASSSILVKSES